MFFRGKLAENRCLWEEVEDMLAGDDDYGTANRYSPDNRTGGRQSTI